MAPCWLVHVRTVAQGLHASYSPEVAEGSPDSQQDPVTKRRTLAGGRAPPTQKLLKIQLFRDSGGEGGIRTPDTLASMPDFESGAFNRALPPLRSGVEVRVSS